MIEPDTPDLVTEDAAEWLDRLASDPTEADSKAFAAWLKRSPVHVEEFLVLSALRDDISGAARRYPERIARLLEDSQSNVVDMGSGWQAPHRRRWFFKPSAMGGHGGWCNRCGQPGLDSAWCVAHLEPGS